MATYFRTKVHKDIGTVPTDILQTVDNNRFTIIGCNLANTTDENVLVNVFVVDADSVAGYFIRELVIQPYTSAKIVTNGEKLILAENCGLRVSSDTEASVDAVISYAEIV